jgi:hypothetical protein
MIGSWPALRGVRVQFFSYTGTPYCVLIARTRGPGLPGVLGSIPKREEPGKTGAPCVEVPGSSRVPWVWVWVWDWIHSHTPPRTRSPSSRHPPFTHYPFPLRSLVCGGQPSPHKPRLVVSHSTCPLLSSSPHAHIFVFGTVVINTHTGRVYDRDKPYEGGRGARVPENGRSDRPTACCGYLGILRLVTQTPRASRYV